MNPSTNMIPEKELLSAKRPKEKYQNRKAHRKQLQPQHNTALSDSLSQPLTPFPPYTTTAKPSTTSPPSTPTTSNHHKAKLFSFIGTPTNEIIVISKIDKTSRIYTTPPPSLQYLNAATLSTTTKLLLLIQMQRYSLHKST